MYKKNRTVRGKTLRLEIEDIWNPLRELQAEDLAVKKANAEARLNNAYVM